MQEQQAQALATQSRLMERAETPDPLAERVRSSRMSWLDAVEGRNGPLDVTKLPGMEPYLDLWNRSRSRRDNARFGTGALRLGTANQNPEIAARSAEAEQATRGQEAGGALYDAFRMRDAEMRESVMSLLGLQQSRDLSLAGLGGSNAANAQNAYMQWLSRPKAPSLWSQIALGVPGAGANIASAGISAGRI